MYLPLTSTTRSFNVKVGAGVRAWEITEKRFEINGIIGVGVAF